MTEINEANGHGPGISGGPVIPGQRAPQDAPPPGVWRGDRPDTTQSPETAADAAAVPFRAKVRTVATHRVTRGAVRQGGYVLAGGRLVARRTWDARTTARHE